MHVDQIGFAAIQRGGEGARDRRGQRAIGLDRALRRNAQVARQAGEVDRGLVDALPDPLVLLRAAAVFLSSHPQLADRGCRFDVLAISGDAAAPSLDWRRNAFEAC